MQFHPFYRVKDYLNSRSERQLAHWAAWVADLLLDPSFDAQVVVEVLALIYLSYLLASCSQLFKADATVLFWITSVVVNRSFPLADSLALHFNLLAVQLKIHVVGDLSPLTHLVSQDLRKDSHSRLLIDIGCHSVSCAASLALKADDLELDAVKLYLVVWVARLNREKLARCLCSVVIRLSGGLLLCLFLSLGSSLTILWDFDARTAFLSYLSDRAQELYKYDHQDDDTDNWNQKLELLVQMNRLRFACNWYCINCEVHVLIVLFFFLVLRVNSVVAPI